MELGASVTAKILQILHIMEFYEISCLFIFKCRNIKQIVRVNFKEKLNGREAYCVNSVQSAATEFDPPTPTRFFSYI